MKNKDYISQINDLLNELENNIDLISFESTYHSIIVISQKICGLTLEFQLKSEDPNSLKCNMRPIQIIHLCERKNIIPRYQSENLHKIRRLNNEVIHGMQPSYQDVYSHLNSFSAYISWFDSPLLDEHYLKKQLKIESLILKINALPKPQNNETIKKNGVKSANIHDFNKIYKKKDDSRLTEKKEEYYINQINKLLMDYEKELTSIFPEKNYYFVFVGQNIIEQMLKLIIEKDGYYISENYYNFFEMIRFSYDNQIIPYECFKFLNLIRRYRNEFAHKIKTPNKLIISFLNAFSSFIEWYDNYYSQLTNSKSRFEIENCCKLIDGLNDEKSKIMPKDDIRYFKSQKLSSKDKQKIDNLEEKSTFEKKLQKPIEENDILNVITDARHSKNSKKNVGEELSKDDEIKKLKSKILIKEELLKKEQLEKEKLQRNEKSLKEELAKKDEEIQNNKQDNDLKMDLILKNLDRNSKLFENCMNILNEHIAATERIETKIDEIDKKIDYITNQISTIQSFTERQLKNASSNEEIEKILESFMDECIDNIMNNSAKIRKNENYEMEKRKLIRSMGESAWTKLSEKSKSFLITSKVMYNHLIMIDDIIDYSGICVLVTKALEVEIHKRFFANFLDYLYEKYEDNYGEYHSALLYKYKIPLLPEKFTMGNIAFVLCHAENRKDSPQQKASNEERLMEYCKSRIFSRYDDDEIKTLLNYYASSIEKIRIKYRNPSAHTNEIKQIDAEECFDLVLDVEKLLKEMLDSFDY